LSYCGDLIIVGPEANKCDYTLKIKARGEALGAFYSYMGMDKGTYRYTGACVSGSTTLEGINVSTDEILFYGKISPLSQINMPDSRTNLYYAPFEDALRQSSFISDLIDLLAEEFGTPFLLDCLKDQNRAIREDAGWALSGMGISAVEPLIGALKAENPNVRDSAVKVLERITYQSFGEDYEAWLKWWQKNKE